MRRVDSRGWQWQSQLGVEEVRQGEMGRRGDLDAWGVLGGTNSGGTVLRWWNFRQRLYIYGRPQVTRRQRRQHGTSGSSKQMRQRVRQGKRGSGLQPAVCWLPAVDLHLQAGSEHSHKLPDNFSLDFHSLKGKKTFSRHQAQDPTMSQLWACEEEFIGEYLGCHHLF